MIGPLDPSWQGESIIRTSGLTEECKASKKLKSMHVGQYSNFFAILCGNKKTGGKQVGKMKHFDMPCGCGCGAQTAVRERVNSTAQLSTRRMALYRHMCIGYAYGSSNCLGDYRRGGWSCGRSISTKYIASTTTSAVSKPLGTRKCCWVTSK